MTRICALILVALALITVSVAGAAADNTSQASASCRGAISWKSAWKYVDRVATIQGPVASTKYASSSNGSPTFLDLGVAYPSPRRFTVVIWIENRSRFGSPERRYSGHTICVHGLVESYRGVPQIEAASPAQIAVVR